MTRLHGTDPDPRRWTVELDVYPICERGASCRGMSYENRCDRQLPRVAFRRSIFPAAGRCLTSWGEMLELEGDAPLRVCSCGRVYEAARCETCRKADAREQARGDREQER